jgi:hypothetical protein
MANPIDWLYATCLEYFIFFSIDSSEARKQYEPGTAYPSGAPEFTPGFSEVRAFRSLVLYVCFVDRRLYFWLLCCLFVFDLMANPIDWLYATCLEYFIFFSIDSSEARKQYEPQLTLYSHCIQVGRIKKSLKGS